MEITYQYTKTRGACGRQAQFCERGPELCDSLPPAEREQKQYMLRNPVHQLTQHAPCFTKHVVNTTRSEIASGGANHAEGGWPRDVNVADPEATQRFRRKVEKDDNYIHCVMSTAPDMEHYIMQNNAISMYETYYMEMASLAEVERNSLRTVNVFRDLAASAGGAAHQQRPGRPVRALAWHPDGGHTFAVCYVDVDHGRNASSTLDCYIWDLENANSPLTTIAPPCSLIDIQYNPREPNVMAGGLINGQVALWDRRSGGRPVSSCELHAAHRDLVRSVLFIASKSGQEFFSAGPDGVCKWWDCRKLDESTEELILDVVKSANDSPSMVTAKGVSVLEYEHTIPTRFMAGTENGLVIAGNRKGKSQLDKLPGKVDAHTGPVWTLKRNPGFMKNFLTVGDWTMRVWSEDCKESAVLWSPPMRHKITDGDWSPTRMSLMLLTQWNGVVSAWDLLRRQHEPVLAMQVCAEPLLRVALQQQGTLAAIGSQKGNVYMVELSKCLTESSKHDKNLMTAMLERESKRERILEARMREIRLKMKQAEEGSPTHSVGEPDAAVGDRDLLAAAADYAAEVKRAAAAT